MHTKRGANKHKNHRRQGGIVQDDDDDKDDSEALEGWFGLIIVPVGGWLGLGLYGAKEKDEDENEEEEEEEKEKEERSRPLQMSTACVLELKSHCRLSGTF